MWSSILMLAIAFLVLLAAIGMKIVAKTSDSRPVFYMAVLGFLALYILAATAISWLNPGLPGANVTSFSELVKPQTPLDDTAPASEPEVIIRQ